MRGEVHVPVPGKGGPLAAGDRQPVAAGINDGERLKIDALQGGLGERGPSRSDKGGAERQEAVAVARRPFRKENNDVSLRLTVGHLRIDVGRVRLPGAVDEDAALQAGEQADHRPFGHLGLGDEGQGKEAAEDGDVHPGHMIRQDQGRPAGIRGLAMNHDPHPEEA